MPVDYLELLKVLDKAISCCFNEPENEEDDICCFCPYIEKECDDPRMNYIALPECLVRDVKIFISESAHMFLTDSGRRLS